MVTRNHWPLAYLPFNKQGQDWALGERRGEIRVHQVIYSITQKKGNCKVNREERVEGSGQDNHSD